MKNLDFKYASAQNFLCFGPEGIEIEFAKYGRVVLIRGNNLDVTEEEERIASNGSGKSSVPEIIVYTLTGKTIKQPKKLSHKDVINNQIGKNLRTEVRWADYRVVRTRSPDSLRIWKSEDGTWDDEHEISGGGMPATQEVIYKELGLTYETLVNVLIFTDNNLGCFLECDTPTKREIVENLLGLSKYVNYWEYAKELRTNQKNLIKDLSREYDFARERLTTSKNRIPFLLMEDSKWQTQKKSELQELQDNAARIKAQLESTDEGAALARYQEAQAKISQNTLLCVELQSKKSKLDEMLDLAQSKLEAARSNSHASRMVVMECLAEIKKCEGEIADWNYRIKNLENNKDSKCDFCYGVVSESNYGTYVRKLRNQIDHNLGEIERQKRLEAIEKEKLETVTANITKLTAAIGDARQRTNNTQKQIGDLESEKSRLEKIARPKDKELNNAVLEEKYSAAQLAIVNKMEEIDQGAIYLVMLHDAEVEVREGEKIVKEKEMLLKEAEKLLPYYEFFVIAFGDKGIRKFVVDGIIPALNSKIADCLQYLIDGKIKLVFDNELSETIERNPSDGDPFVYHAMSGGERRRLNLSVSKAFSHVMTVNSGRSVSAVFLDEVTTNIDPIGVIGVYNMIMELSKEQQVFVTTHDQGLLEMLEGSECLVLEKKNGFTKVAQAAKR